MTVTPYTEPTKAPLSHGEILQDIGVAYLAAHLRLPYSTVYGWLHRESIPPEYFRRIVHYSRQEPSGHSTSLKELAAWSEWFRLIH